MFRGGGPPRKQSFSIMPETETRSFGRSGKKKKKKKISRRVLACPRHTRGDNVGMVGCRMLEQCIKRIGGQGRASENIGTMKTSLPYLLPRALSGQVRGGGTLAINKSPHQGGSCVRYFVHPCCCSSRLRSRYARSALGASWSMHTILCRHYHISPPGMT